MANLSTPTGQAPKQATTTKSLSDLIDTDVFAAGGGFFGNMEEVATERKAGLDIENLPSDEPFTPAANDGRSSTRDYSNIA